MGAKACPHCGSDEETGWQDNPESESGLAGEFTDDFDYEDFLEREFPDPQKRNGAQGNRLAWILLVLALAGFVASTFLLF